MKVEELVSLMEKSGFAIHSGMRGQLTWKGGLRERLQDLTNNIIAHFEVNNGHKYRNDSSVHD